MHSKRQAEAVSLSYEDVRDIARKISESESSTQKINIYKGSLSAVRCERRLLYVMLGLLAEIKKDVTRSKAVSLVCSDPESFKTLSKDDMYEQASDMLIALRSHISVKGTPHTAAALELLGEFPLAIQKKAMIMAIYDLTENS